MTTETTPARTRTGWVWTFGAGLVAGGFLFYALAWRTGALVPGHWLTLSSRDVITSPPTRVAAPSPLPTFPFPTPAPSPAAVSSSAFSSSEAASPGVVAPVALQGPFASAPSSKPPAATLLAGGFPVPAIALLLPVVGAHVRDLKDDFGDARGGTRRHEAIDILAPRGTPVVAAVDGHVAKLFTSQQGGLTVYEFDAAGEYCYYYAHLDRYAPGLAEGMAVKRGDRIGDVGTTGNAPKNTPHLHFAVFRLGSDKRWWDGEPVNPFPLLQKAEER